MQAAVLDQSGIDAKKFDAEVILYKLRERFPVDLGFFRQEVKYGYFYPL